MNIQYIYTPLSASKYFPAVKCNQFHCSSNKYISPITTYLFHFINIDTFFGFSFLRKYIHTYIHTHYVYIR